MLRLRFHVLFRHFSQRLIAIRQCFELATTNHSSRDALFLKLFAVLDVHLKHANGTDHSSLRSHDEFRGCAKPQGRTRHDGTRVGHDRFDLGNAADKFASVHHTAHGTATGIHHKQDTLHALICDQLRHHGTNVVVTDHTVKHHVTCSTCNEGAADSKNTNAILHRNHAGVHQVFQPLFLTISICTEAWMGIGLRHCRLEDFVGILTT